MNIDITEIIKIITPHILEYGLRILFAILILFIGFKLVKYVNILIAKSLKKANVDITLSKFLLNLTDIGLKILVVIIVASVLGVKMTSFVGLFAAAGLAIGLALQGSLSNFAGGVLIFTLKPFKVGDIVEVNNETGKVKEIQIFNTVILTADNKTIILPNGPLSNNNIINYSTEGIRRIDIIVGIGYDSDIKKAKQIIEKILLEDERVLEEPKIQIGVSELGDSSVNMVVRPWADSEDYWNVKFDFLERCKEEFDKENITIPYPHTEVILNSK